VIVDDCLFATIIAGIGLAVTYPRAEYVSYRGFRAVEHNRSIVQRELHANRLELKQIDEPLPTSRNHQPFLSKGSALCAPDGSRPTVYSRKSTDIGIARHREPA
jgi:hypothetical protein